MVIEERSGKFYPNELMDHMFEMTRFHNARILGVEVTSLHEWISQPIENEMRVRGVFAQYQELKAIGKKEERVAGLAPFYRQDKPRPLLAKTGQVPQHKPNHNRIPPRNIGGVPNPPQR